MAEILAGEATSAQIAGVHRGPPHEGRDHQRDGRPARRHAGRLRAGPPAVGRRRGRHRRHRRRPQPLDQRVDHLRAGRGRRRGQGVQARQPGRLLLLRRRPTCSRPSAWSSTSGPRAWPAASPRRASASASPRGSTRPCATPAPPARSWACPRCSTSSARWPTRPGSGATSSASGDPSMAERMAEVLLAHGAERAFVVHGGDGLDEITITTTSNVIEVVDGEVRPSPSTPPSSAWGRPAWRTSGAATRPPTPAWPGPCSPATRAPTATSWCSTPPPGWWPPARWPTTPPASRRPGPRLDSGAAADALERLVTTSVAARTDGL